MEITKNETLIIKSESMVNDAIAALKSRMLDTLKRQGQFKIDLTVLEADNSETVGKKIESFNYSIDL